MGNSSLRNLRVYILAICLLISFNLFFVGVNQYKKHETNFYTENKNKFWEDNSQLIKYPYLSEEQVMNYSVVSNWNDNSYGYGRSLFVQNDIAYVAYEEGLYIINISNPNSPDKLAIYERSDVIDVYVQDNYAYILQGLGRRAGYLEIIDIYNPSRPIGYGIFDKVGMSDIFVQREIAYLAARENGLRIVNVSHPLNPKEIGRIGVLQEDVQGVAVKDNFAYITGYNNGLVIYDVSTPSKPTKIGECSTEVIFGEDIIIIDNYAYVAESEGLTVFDIKKPSKPKIITRISYEERYNEIQFNDNFAILTGEYESGLRIFDCSNPKNPELKSSIISTGFAGAVKYNNYLITVPKSSLLKTFEMSDPTRLIALKELKDDGNTKEFIVKDNIAYCIESFNTLEIVDFSNPYQPIEISNYFSFVNTMSINLQDNLLFLTHYNNGFEIIDVSDPITPQQITNYRDGWDYRGGCVKGNYLYLYDGGYGFRIFNIANPSTVSLVSEIYTHYINDLFITDNNLLFVPLYEDNVNIYDVSNPTIPNQISTIILNESVTSIYYENNIAYFGIKDGFAIVDLTDIMSPQLLNKTKIVTGIYSGKYSKVAIENDLLYFVLEDYCLNIYNISSLENPILIGKYYGLFPGDIRLGLHVINNSIFLIDSNGGVSLIGIDTDNDNVADDLELNIYLTNHTNQDTDSDMISDGLEINKYQSNPLYHDTDYDYLDDYQEIVIYGTDPTNMDTDHDTIIDYTEIQDGSDPLNPNDPIPLYTFVTEHSPYEGDIVTVVALISFSFYLKKRTIKRKKEKKRF